MLKKATSDVTLGRAVFRAEDTERANRLHMSVVRVLEEKERIRWTHDLTFEGPRRGADGKPKRTVDVDTD